VWLRGLDGLKGGGHVALAWKQRVSDTGYGAGGRLRSETEFGVPNAPRARVLLIDDHAILREGLSALINVESDLEVVGQVGSISEAVRIAGSLPLDLIITDIRLPVKTGTEDIVELRSLCPSARLLALTAHNSAESIRAAFAAGADGYLLKDATRVEFISAVRAVLAGQRHLCPRSMARVVHGYLDESKAPPPVAIGITVREREVLAMIANGQSNKRMAMALDLSIKTIEKHRANLMRKLGFRNLAEVTRFALESGILEGSAANQSAQPIPAGYRATTERIIKA
jgi:two-component system, NarL family, response regulator NreC